MALVIDARRPAATHTSDQHTSPDWDERTREEADDAPEPATLERMRRADRIRLQVLEGCNCPDQWITRRVHECAQQLCVERNEPHATEEIWQEAFKCTAARTHAKMRDLAAALESIELDGTSATSTIAPAAARCSSVAPPSSPRSSQPPAIATHAAASLVPTAPTPEPESSPVVAADAEMVDSDEGAEATEVGNVAEPDSSAAAHAEPSDFASQLARIRAEAAARHATSSAADPAVPEAAMPGHVEVAPASACEESSTTSAAAAPAPPPAPPAVEGFPPAPHIAHPLHECLICREPRADTYPELADGTPCWRSEADPDARHWYCQACLVDRMHGFGGPTCIGCGRPPKPFAQMQTVDIGPTAVPQELQGERCIVCRGYVSIRGNEIIVCGCDNCTQSHPLFRKAVHLGCTGSGGWGDTWLQIPRGNMYFADADQPDDTHVPDGGITDDDRVFVYHQYDLHEDDLPEGDLPEGDLPEDAAHAVEDDPMEEEEPPLARLLRLSKPADRAGVLAEMLLPETPAEHDPHELAERVGLVQFKAGKPELYSFSTTKGYRPDVGGRTVTNLIVRYVVPQLQALQLNSASERRTRNQLASMLGNHFLNESVRKHLVKYFVAELAVAQSALRLDTNPTLLGGEGGVLDLQTKTVRPYRPQDLVSKSVGFEIVMWESIPPATKLELEKVLAQLWPDEDQRDFMIRLNAQTLDGSVRKYVLCSIGPSNSGKSLDGELLCAALGREAGYAATVTTKSLSTHPPAQDKMNPEVIGLEGKRLASQFEADLANAKPSVPKLQSWSGGDPIPVREARAPMNRDPPVTPTWQLHVASNSTPDASQLDDSLRDRIVLDIRRCRFASEPAEELSVFPLRSVHTTHGPKPLKDAIQAGLPYRTAEDPSLPEHDLPKAYLALLISKYDARMTTIDVRMARFQLTPRPPYGLPSDDLVALSAVLSRSKAIFHPYTASSMRRGRLGVCSPRSARGMVTRRTF